VYAVEPESSADTALSLAAGSRRVVAESGRTICDGLRAPTPGAITFALNRRLLAGVVTVTDDEVRAAMALAARYAKLVVEPSGAAGLAAALKDSRQERRRVGVVLSGGNVDLEMLAEVLHSGVAA
jgi:threonine dehydratase